MRIIGWRAERDLAVEAHLLWLSRTVGEFVLGFLLYFPPRPLQEFGPSSELHHFSVEHRIVPWVFECVQMDVILLPGLNLGCASALMWDSKWFVWVANNKKQKKDNMIDEFCHSVVLFSLSLSFWSLMLSPYRDTASRCARGEAWCHRV